MFKFHKQVILSTYLSAISDSASLLLLLLLLVVVFFFVFFIIMIILIWSFLPLPGLRGAIPYALSLHLGLEPIEKRQLIGTTTIIIVLFTILFLGGGTMPLIRIMDIEESQSRRKSKKDINLSKTEKMVRADESLSARHTFVHTHAYIPARCFADCFEAVFFYLPSDSYCSLRVRGL